MTGPRLFLRAFGTAEKGRRERWVVRVAAQQQQRADEVAADNRSDEVGDLLTGPDEIPLEVRQADLAIVCLLNQPYEITLIREDLHGAPHPIVRSQA